MRPKQHKTTGSADLFRARLEQIINMKHELVQLAGKLDWTLSLLKTLNAGENAGFIWLLEF